MPIREYQCKECQLKFETIELGGKSERVKCPRCHSENVEKRLSLFSSTAQEGKSCSRFTRGFG